jgi:hypothetical protein
MDYWDDRNVVAELERIATALERIAAALTTGTGQHGPSAPLKGLPDLKAPRPPSDQLEYVQ